MWSKIKLLAILVFISVVRGDTSQEDRMQSDGRQVNSNSVTDLEDKGDENSGLVCPSCEQMHCYPRRSGKLKCPGGMTLGVCGCCPVCAKLENEACGGQHHFLGKCDRGLKCDVTHTQVWKVKDGQAKGKTYHIPRGVCRPVPPSEMLLSDQAYSPYCQPPCTPEFCAKNPNAICSASEVAEKSRPCQDPCQHTACPACKLVPPEPQCGKCKDGDYGCYKRFARCVRKHTCSRPRYPCAKDSIYDIREEIGKFICLVPTCVD